MGKFAMVRYFFAGAMVTSTVVQMAFELSTLGNASASVIAGVIVVGVAKVTAASVA